MERLSRKQDDLDELVTSIRHESGTEKIWEGYQNTLINEHPYLVGHAFILGLALLVFTTHLTMFVISSLFLYLISDFMTRDVHRVTRFIPKIVLFSVLYIVFIAIIILLSYKVIPLLMKHFPEWINQLQAATVKELRAANIKWNVSQYVDLEEVKGAIANFGSWILRFLVDSMTPIYKGFIQFVFALAINLLMYFEAEKVKTTFTRHPNSLMTFLYSFVQVRFKIFYIYFKRVMGGQILISLVNTAISATIIFGIGLPHPFLMLFIVFFCGLFPIIGNLISNSVLIINAFISIGLWGAGVCLFLLIAIHKLEYFLNSRIIGGMVRLPMAVSLAALILWDVILGIPGLILAIPLALFIRHEFEHIPGYTPNLLEDDLASQAEARSAPSAGRQGR